MKKILNIAHRGASAYEHENTLASIYKAIDLGADMVEFDLRQTADGVIVLWHDPQIRNSSGKTAPISKITMDDLNLYSGDKGFQAATFGEVLKEFGSKIAFDIEIKAPGFEEDVIKLLQRFPSALAPMISSYHPAVIRKIKDLNPLIKTGLVVGNSPIIKLGLMPVTVLRRHILKSKANSAHLNLGVASESIINDLTEFGFEIYIWTVNDEKDMKCFITMNVDGIITDKPDVLNTVKNAAKDVSLSL